MESITKLGRSRRTKKLLLVCACGCGTQFYRYKNKIRSRNFVNQQHRAASDKRECTEAQCGPYLELFITYMAGTAPRIYRDLRTVRLSLRPFFLFLTASEVMRLEDVTPATVTAFKLWGLKNGHHHAANDTSALSTFFMWAISEERYPGANPVVSVLHAKRAKPRVGRPYSSEEMSALRQLLEQKGNPKLRAFFEIAAESGLRANEICRLRMQDVSLTKRELFVGLPNKTMTERTAHFFTRAERHIREWLEVRRDDCGHDFLFQNKWGKPLKYGSIKEEFGRTFSVRSGGITCGATGFQSFSLHRLRHTQASGLASNGADASTLMKSLGWVSPASIDGYVKTGDESKKQSFVEAMDKVEASEAACLKQTLSQDEFLLSMGA